MITRRPSVRIETDSVKIRHGVISFDVQTRDQITFPPDRRRLSLDVTRAGTPADFRTHVDGSYFSVKLGTTVAHGDAWALSSLATRAHDTFAGQEILYVGQAFGTEGQMSAFERTRRHKKLQRIYEDHAGVDWDIFVVPLTCTERLSSTCDHIDDDDKGFSMSAYFSVFVNQGGPLRKPAVDLIEHSLISHFSPPYNEMLTEWRPSQPTGPMRKMRSVGFRLLQVHLDGWGGLARFYSSQVPTRTRSHFISQDMPPEPARPVLRGISADRLSEWTLEAQFVRHGQDYFAIEAEASDAVLHIFGSEAPAIRRPPEVALASNNQPDEPIPEDDGWTEPLADELPLSAAEQQRVFEVFPRPDQPTYDSASGCIWIAPNRDSARVPWRLHDPTDASIEHGLIIGTCDSGKSKLLRNIGFEAARSQLFEIYLVRLGEDGYTFDNEMNWTGRLNPPIKDLKTTIELLQRIVHIIRTRVKGEFARRIGVGRSGIMVVMDDADDILFNPATGHLCEQILTHGHLAGVSLVVAVRQYQQLERHSGVASEVIRVKNVWTLMPNGPAVLAELRSIHRLERPSTYLAVDQPSYILHVEPTGASVGQLVSVTDRALTPNQAQRWVSLVLDAHADALIDWQMLNEDPRTWWTIDAKALSQWFIRRHSDCWALINVYARTGLRFDRRGEAMVWADGALKNRFEVELDEWTVGPTTDEASVVALYADSLRAPIARGRPASFVWSIVQGQATTKKL